MTTTYRRALNSVPIAFHGSPWHMQVGARRTDTGAIVDFTAEPIASMPIKLTLRNRWGKVVGTIDNQGSTAGSISGGPDGLLSLFMPASMVNALPLTREYRTGSDPRTSPWRQRGVIVMSLTVDDGVNAPWELLDTACQLVVSPRLRA